MTRLIPNSPVLVPTLIAAIIQFTKENPKTALGMSAIGAIVFVTYFLTKPEPVKI